MFFFSFLDGVVISTQAFTLGLVWSLEFGTGPRCNCFTMPLLNCAVAKTEATYGILSYSNPPKCLGLRRRLLSLLLLHFLLCMLRLSGSTVKMLAP